MNGIRVLIKETPESSLQPKGGPHQPCGHLDLGLPASRTVKNKCLLFINHRTWNCVTVAWTDRDTAVSSAGSAAPPGLPGTALVVEGALCLCGPYSTICSPIQQLTWPPDQLLREADEQEVFQVTKEGNEALKSAQPSS